MAKNFEPSVKQDEQTQNVSLGPILKMNERKDIFIKMNISATPEEIKDFFCHSIDL